MDTAQLSPYNASLRKACLELLPPDSIEVLPDAGRIKKAITAAAQDFSANLEEIPSIVRAFCTLHKLNAVGMQIAPWQQFLVDRTALRPASDAGEAGLPLVRDLMHEYELRRLLLQGAPDPFASGMGFPLFGGNGKLAVEELQRQLSAGEQQLPGLAGRPSRDTRLPMRQTGAEPFVHSFTAFQRNMEHFSQGLLFGLDLGADRLVVGGSATMACALPVLPAGMTHVLGKRFGRSVANCICDYMAEVPPWLDASTGAYKGSDVDLFVIADTLELANERLIAAAQRVYRNMCGASKRLAPADIGTRDPEHVLIATTGNTLTICGHYPLRHVQIVAYVAKSLQEILAFVDLDCTSMLFDGANVWAAPRAVRAHCTGYNFMPRGWLLHVDCSGCAHVPSRVAKYLSRGWGLKLCHCCFHSPKCGPEATPEVQAMLDAIHVAHRAPPKLWKLVQKAVSHWILCAAAQEERRLARAAARRGGDTFYDTSILFPGIPRGPNHSPASVRQMLTQRRTRNARLPKDAQAECPEPIKHTKELSSRGIACQLVRWRADKANNSILDCMCCF